MVPLPTVTHCLVLAHALDQTLLVTGVTNVQIPFGGYHKDWVVYHVIVAVMDQ